MTEGLREQLVELTTTKDSSELEKQLADQTHSVVLLAENGVWMKEKLRIAERKAGEKWRSWAEKEKEAQVKAGKTASAERKN